MRFGRTRTVDSPNRGLSSRRWSPPTYANKFACLPSNPSDSCQEIKKAKVKSLAFSMAEREGFEPPDSCLSTVFKTAAFNRSAISPRRRKFRLNAFAYAKANFAALRLLFRKNLAWQYFSEVIVIKLQNASNFAFGIAQGYPQNQN